ncbi:hypothetical protein [Caproicibacter sp. BJN0012]
MSCGAEHYTHGFFQEIIFDFDVDDFFAFFNGVTYVTIPYFPR